MYRQFDDATEEVARAWRSTAIIDCRIVQNGRWTSWGDGACAFRLPDDRQCFGKPRQTSTNTLLICREKIASDLGFDLGLPVAPVIIRRNCRDWPQWMALSLVTLDGGRHWHPDGPKHLGAAVDVLEALRVFWTWIADHDHEGHHANLLYEVAGGALKFVSIDHGQSLGHGMTGSLMEIPAALGYGTRHLPGAEGHRQTLVQRIQAVGDGALDEIVGRLGDVLSTPERQRILDLLRQRRDGLEVLLRGDDDATA